MVPPNDFASDHPVAPRPVRLKDFDNPTDESKLVKLIPRKVAALKNLYHAQMQHFKELGIEGPPQMLGYFGSLAGGAIMSLVKDAITNESVKNTIMSRLNKAKQAWSSTKGGFKNKAKVAFTSALLNTSAKKAEKITSGKLGKKNRANFNRLLRAVKAGLPSAMDHLMKFVNKYPQFKKRKQVKYLMSESAPQKEEEEKYIDLPYGSQTGPNQYQLAATIDNLPPEEGKLIEKEIAKVVEVPDGEDNVPNM